MCVRVCARAQISLGLGLRLPQPLHIQLYIYIESLGHFNASADHYNNIIGMTTFPKYYSPIDRTCLLCQLQIDL